MTATLSSILFFILWVALASCNPKDPLPIDTWSKGSVQLAPDPQGFRLSGLCCAYVILPKVELNKKKQFSVKADFYTFTGAGFASVPAIVKGGLSNDGNILTISYSTNSVVTTYELQPGAATTAPTCGCF